MARKYFGTDGIRGRVGEFPITADFFLRLGWAAGTVLTRNAKGKKRVLIGKDTRVSGYMFESALEAGLIAAGVDVDMLGPMPTPAIAYLTRTFRAAAGIVISASHNPFEDNGIKFFAADGYKKPDVSPMPLVAMLSFVRPHCRQVLVSLASKLCSIAPMAPPTMSRQRYLKNWALPPSP